MIGLLAGRATAAPATTSRPKAPPQKQSVPADSLARIVPEDAGAFVEIRDLARLGAKLLPGGGWADLTELAAGQTSQPAVTVAWGHRLTRILGMSLAEATRNLFGRHVALAAPSYDNLAEGVVLARAPDARFISQLIAKNQGKKQPPVGNVSCYTLREGLSLAVKDTVVVLGRRAGETRFFERSVDLLAGEAANTLFDLPSFGEQVGQLPSASQGLLYLDLPTPTAKTTEVKEPAAGPRRRSTSQWSSLRRAAVGLYENGTGLDLEIRGLLDRPVVRGGLKDVSLEPIGRLPRSTLVVWAQTLDLTGWYRTIMADRGPEQRSLRFNLEVVRALLHPTDLEKDLLEKLGPQIMLVCGYEPSDEQRAEGAYDLPLVALMVESRDVRAASAILLRLSERLLGWMKVQFARAKRSLELSVVEAPYHGTTIYRMELGSLFRRDSRCPYLKTLELCWAGVDDWLIVASHPDHIRQIIDARQAPASDTFAATAAFGAIERRNGVSSVVLVRPSRAARVLQSWIDYCSEQAPHVFKPLWWKRMMVRRGGRRVELGIIIREGAEPGRVVVGNPVLPEMPAAGRLRPGDKICTVDGIVLSEDRPEDDLRDFIALRGGKGVVLRVERDGKLLDVRIPLSPPPPLPVAADIDPIRSIRHLIGLGRGLSVGGYVASHAGAHHYNATLVVRMDRANSGGR